MLLKDLKQNMLLPNKEIFINKIVKIRGIDVLLISITSEKHMNVLWTMYRLPLPCYFNEEIDSEETPEYTSNRDKMANDITKETTSFNIFISEIMIQKQKMKFSSSNTRQMSHMNYEKYMQLQHFIENGMDTTNWNEEDLDNIVIVTYEQKESEEFPVVDGSKELDITLKVRRDAKLVLIDEPICFKFNKMEKNKKFYFYDYIEKKNRIFYIDKIEYYDVWEEAKHKFEDERIQTFKLN